MRTWPFWITVVAVFTSGLVIGSGLTVFILHQQRMRMFRNPEAVRQKLLVDVKAELDLDDAQVAAIDEVLKRRIEALDEMRKEIHPRVEREIGLIESQVAEVLPADRREQWHAYFKRFCTEWLPPPPPPFKSTEAREGSSALKTPSS